MASEETPAPVSSLRSKFEQLALESASSDQTPPQRRSLRISSVTFQRQPIPSPVEVLQPPSTPRTRAFSSPSDNGVDGAASLNVEGTANGKASSVGSTGIQHHRSQNDLRSPSPSPKHARILSNSMDSPYLGGYTQAQLSRPVPPPRRQSPPSPPTLAPKPIPKKKPPPPPPPPRIFQNGKPHESSSDPERETLSRTSSNGSEAMTPPPPPPRTLPRAKIASLIPPPLPHRSVQSMSAIDTVSQIIPSPRPRSASPLPIIKLSPNSTANGKVNDNIDHRLSSCSLSEDDFTKYNRNKSGSGVTSTSSSTRSSSETSDKRSQDDSLPTPRAPPPLPPPRPTPLHASSTDSNNSISTTSSNDTVPPPLPSRLRRSPVLNNNNSNSSPALLSSPTLRSSEVLPPPSRVNSIPPINKAPFKPANGGGSPKGQLPPPPTNTSSDFHLPPPPTRTIGLGDKLPPPRRAPHSGDGDSSGEDGEEPEVVGSSKSHANDLPDSSRSSRRPPYRFPQLQPHQQPSLHIAAHVGVVASAGNIVCIGSTHLKVYDLSQPPSTPHPEPIWHIELRDTGLEWRVKDPRITSLAFTAALRKEDEGKFLWCGTKDGHLWELDLELGCASDTRASLHGCAVTHILRWGGTMITLDESGKAYFFSPTEGGKEVNLGESTPKAQRIADKQGFARVLSGQLWTSSGSGSGSSGSAFNPGASSASLLTQPRGPTIRVYDLKSPTLAVKTLVPPESLGAVTSGTILPSQPSQIYIGHEGGSISIFTSQTLEFIKSVKISASDVLSLEGAYNRLWAGNRKGYISAYDVGTMPWSVTNVWNAHGEYPVTKLAVDVVSVEKCGQLTVISVGRDEQVRLWDGLLGVDWIETELLKREASFSSFRTIKALICTWNIDAAKPEALVGNAENTTFLENCLQSVEAPDIIVFGFQEVIDLENRKLTAKTVLLGGQKNRDGSLSEKVSRHYKLWYDKLVLAVRLAMSPSQPFTVVHTESLVGLFTCIFVKNSEKRSLSDMQISTVKRGMGGRYGNKGAIVARFVVDDSSICFINCHLAAGQSHKNARNRDVASILEEKELFPEPRVVDDCIPYVGGGDGSMVLDHEICFLNGDLNYRIDLRCDAVVSHIEQSDLGYLLSHDQLLKEMKSNPGFRLRAFKEAPIAFSPTYKYDRNSHEFDTSEKRRVPAWCDRILYRSRDESRVTPLHYRRYEPTISDHRPVSAGFEINVKSLRKDERAVVKHDIIQEWEVYQVHLLQQVEEFYSKQLWAI